MKPRLFQTAAIAAGLLGLILVLTPPAFADLDGLSVSMDGQQYNIGDSGTLCYAVPGPGQVTITNNGVGGTVPLLTRRDDGSGSCDTGPIKGPAGRYCVVILYAGEAGVGTAQTCYQVFDPASAS
ncbi:MAG TPA: hypothetical protein VK821_17605 [Dehalococcoidia bacterium]|nr:hypothetical protein [Dehalococcoidia bacterium]